MDLSVNYMGLKLKNPIIAASSGLTANIEGIQTLEAAGVSAVVLKSLFEEQIMFNYRTRLENFKMDSIYP
ncbi:MAG: hypothetical protein ACM3N9_08715, partial [Syntrophothermus sp.]